MKFKYPVVLTIAGSDPSGGAGIQADLKTITVLKCYGASVITALTAQNTEGVQGIFPITDKFIEKQLDSVFSDIKTDAVKIGMLHDSKVIKSIAKKIKEYNINKIILDPVMVATSGDTLLENNAVKALIEKLFPLAYLITPNIKEAEVLSKIKITGNADMIDAILKIKNLGAKNILLKGGDIDETNSNDLLLISDSIKDKLVWFKSKKINSKNTHGTGCTLSSAIASFTARGYGLEKAISSAKHFITGAIISAKNQNPGCGRGPVDHLYKL